MVGCSSLGDTVKICRIIHVELKRKIQFNCLHLFLILWLFQNSHSTVLFIFLIHFLFSLNRESWSLHSKWPTPNKLSWLEKEIKSTPTKSYTLVDVCEYDDGGLTWVLKQIRLPSEKWNIYLQLKTWRVVALTSRIHKQHISEHCRRSVNSQLPFFPGDSHIFSKISNYYFLEICWFLYISCRNRNDLEEFSDFSVHVHSIFVVK